MKTISIILFSFLVSAADAPTLTIEQRLTIRESQISILNNRAEIAETESRLKDLYQQRPALQKAFDESVLKVTPPGFKMMPDLSFTRCKWAEEPGCGASETHSTKPEK